MAHTNFCDIGFALDAPGERLIVVACLDNLGKVRRDRQCKISTG